MITVIYSDKFLLYDTGKNHPERPERLLAIVTALNISLTSKKKSSLFLAISNQIY
ncbi:histone deacetylase superfamily protein [Nostoc sp. NIES-3756]|uniref:hypothetical protein n=1 Tax=Nostoc sp. NIES-3756 TaxID=1751286 RepID=UPI0007217778|nr:hypothetical protein [Nostoc sp. NIES-3756]BAT51343.1 histone deacetylase superfamily protein [Nostoc sp. NIES-3756]